MIAVRLSLHAAQDGQTDAQAAAMSYETVILARRLDQLPELQTLPLQASDDGRHVELQLVTEHAVVCDLCAHLPSKQPVCVSQCPHEAAIRVNARRDFDDLLKGGYHAVN